MSCRTLLLLLVAQLAHALVLQPAMLRRPVRAAPVSALRMQQDGGGFGQSGERERQRGRSATIAKPKPKPKSRRKEDVEKEGSWRVLLHNDDVHTFDYVNMAIVRVVKTITRKKAHRITVQAHSMGTATVTTTWKQMAKQYCLKLQKYGLTSSIAPEGD